MHYAETTPPNDSQKDYAMKKLLTVGAIGILSLLLATSLFDIKNGLDLFMNTSLFHDSARIMLIVALLVTLVVSRPRPKVLRLLLAAVSLMITASSLISAVNFTLQLFDTLAYILAAVILMTESLEVEEPRSKSKTAKPLTANQPTL